MIDPLRLLDRHRLLGHVGDAARYDRHAQGGSAAPRAMLNNTAPPPRYHQSEPDWHSGTARSTKGLPNSASRFVIPQMSLEASKSDQKWRRYVGSTVTAVIALLPWISDFFIAAIVIGAFTAIWFAARRQKQFLTFNDGAELGFNSGFYGMLAASAIYSFVRQFFHYELWQIKNLDRLFLLLGEKLRDIVSLSAWIVTTVQCIVAAILGGAIGAPSGLLAVKIFQRRRSN